MTTKEQLKEYAGKLLFDMEEDQYQTLLHEFEVILKEMDLIGKIEGIFDVEPMTFPFVVGNAVLREDDEVASLPVDEVLANAKDVLHDQVRVPKVVE